MNCYEAIDVMGDAAEDRLDPSYAANFQEHMEECPSCAAYYEQLRITRGALKDLPPSDSGTPPKRNQLLEQFRREFDKRSS